LAQVNADSRAALGNGKDFGSIARFQDTARYNLVLERKHRNAGHWAGGDFCRFPIFFNAVSPAKNDRRPVDFNGLAGAGILPAGTLERKL
jgi:hypothetical protein